MPVAATRGVYLRHTQVHGERPAGGGDKLYALQVYVWWLWGCSDRYVSPDLKYIKALFCCDRTTPTTVILHISPLILISQGSLHKISKVGMSGV